MSKWIERHYWTCYWRRFAIGGTNWYFVLLLKPLPADVSRVSTTSTSFDTAPLWTYRLGLFIFFLCKYGFISDELYLCGNRFSEISLCSVPVFSSCDVLNVNFLSHNKHLMIYLKGNCCVYLSSICFLFLINNSRVIDDYTKK